MKKIISITAIVILFSITITAQRNQRGISQKSDLTTEQRAELQTKRMALTLDLDANQQKEVQKMLLKSGGESNKMRDEFRQKKQSGELTADERFAFENSRLERQMVHKNEMKKILNKDQYSKWESTVMNKSRDGRNGKSKGNKSNSFNCQRKNAPKQLNKRG